MKANLLPNFLVSRTMEKSAYSLSGTGKQKETVLSRPEVAGGLQKWSIELGDVRILTGLEYRSKGNIADFLVDDDSEEQSSDTIWEKKERNLPNHGSCLRTNHLAQTVLGFDATNNEAEYEALIAGQKIVKQIGVKNLQANVDSRLVANQVNGTYVAKENDMVRYLEKVKTFINIFKAFSIKQVPRSENKKADALSKISSSFAHLSKQVLVEELKEKSISTVEVLAVVEEEGDTWMTPIFKYLMDGTLPAEVKKALKGE
ncbi:reverse transcriptase domain-containing protein [Tanacetum coccineum]